MHLSESAANFWNDFANWALIAGSIIVLLATAVLYWTGKVKESYADQALKDAKVDAAEANKKASLANDKAEHLGHGLASRTITQEQILILKENIIAGAQVSIVEIADEEAESYGDDIATALRTAGAIVTVGKNNVFIPPPIGIRVRFNHEDPKSKSVFSAFNKAGINPIDEGNTDNSVVYIKAGIKSNQF